MEPEPEPEPMGDEHVIEPEFGSYSPTNDSHKRKAVTTDDTDNDDRRATRMKRITLALTKPSFVMGLGPKMVRAENRSTLLNFMHKLMMQHNWVEASGVLSMLLKGTLRDRCPIKNRLKYSVKFILPVIEGSSLVLVISVYFCLTLFFVMLLFIS